MPNNRRGFGRMASNSLVSSTEKLSNPGFESSGSVLTSWDVGAGVNASINTTGTYLHGGSRSAHLTWSNIDDTLGQDVTSFTAGAAYLLSGYIRVITGMALVYMWDLAIGTNGESIGSLSFDQNEEFEEFNIIFIAPHTSAILQIAAAFDFTEVYLDDFSIKRVN